mmetsp:Transcript_58387/g.120667  ORF Transcript_58387/g.120667 Transcript_58387/m.120667 type:complete len:91 (+) Transcript_58387:540-812(+)
MFLSPSLQAVLRETLPTKALTPTCGERLEARSNNWHCLTGGACKTSMDRGAYQCCRPGSTGLGRCRTKGSGEKKRQNSKDLIGYCYESRC